MDARSLGYAQDCGSEDNYLLLILISHGALVSDAVRPIALANDGGCSFATRAWDYVDIEAAGISWLVNASVFLFFD